MTKPEFQYYNYIELFLAFDCTLILIFNINVLIQKKVYQSWSSATILLAFSLLLLARIGCLLFYVAC